MISSTAIFFSIFVNILFFLIHVIIWRFIDNKSPKLGLLSFIFFISYLFLSFIILYFLEIRINQHFWLTAPTSFLIFILYLHFYVGMLKSVSLRIMAEVLKRENKKIKLNELEKIYSFKSMVEPRLNLLSNKKWLDKVNNVYICTNASIILARINLIFHKLFRLDITG